jgi:hypothetical protein
MKLMSDCTQAYRSYPASQQLITVNTLENSVIDFAFTDGGKNIGKILFPSSAISHPKE